MPFPSSNSMARLLIKAPLDWLWEFRLDRVDSPPPTPPPTHYGTADKKYQTHRRNPEQKGLTKLETF